MKKASKKQGKERLAPAVVPESRIRLSDISEISDWRGAVRGKFYRPIKKSLTIRLDADLLAWLGSEGSGYQTRINKLLRAAMEAKRRRA